MKRFTKKLIAFLGIFAAVLLALDLLSATERFRGAFAVLTDSSGYEEEAEREVSAYLAKSRMPGSYTKLLVGDSVCAQMTEAFFDCNQQYCLVGNNRALTMAGEYLLVKEFLETHENVSEVWLMAGPDLLQTSIDATYSYSYVVLPFLQADLLDELDEETAEEMEETFGSLFLKKPVAELIAGSAVNRKLYLNYVKEREEALEKGESRENQTVGMSDLAERYLRKIYELCDAQGVACYLIPIRWQIHRRAASRWSRSGRILKHGDWSGFSRIIFLKLPIIRRTSFRTEFILADRTIQRKCTAKN